MLLQSVNKRSLSVSFRSLQQSVCLRSKRRIDNFCSSFFVSSLQQNMYGG